MPERRSTRRERLARRLARLKRWEANSSARDFTDDVTGKRWRRREARHKPVDAAELQRCRENPELAGTIAGSRYVRCLECGRDFEELGSHLWFAHRMKGSAYQASRSKAPPQIAPLISRALSKARAQATRTQLADPRRRVALHAKQRREFPSWPVLELTLGGQSQAEISVWLTKNFVDVDKRRPQVAIWRYLHRWGFERTRRRYDLGVRWDLSQTRALKQRLGLSKSEFARMGDVPKALLSVSVVPAGRDPSPETARKLIRVRDELLSKALKINYKHRQDLWPCSARQVLFTFVPELVGVCRCLRSVLPELQQFARENPEAGFDALKEHIFELVERAPAARKKIVGEFLKVAPDVLPILDLQRLRGEDRLGRMARDMVCELAARRWGAKPSVVRLECRNPVPASKMRVLLRELAREQEGAEPEQARAPIGELEGKEENRRQELSADLPAARPRGRPPSLREIILKAMELREREKLSWRQCAERLIPPEKFKKDPKAAGQRLANAANIYKRRLKKDPPIS